MCASILVALADIYMLVLNMGKCVLIKYIMFAAVLINSDLNPEATASVVILIVHGD